MYHFGSVAVLRTYIYICCIYITGDPSLAGGNVFSIPIYRFLINQVTKFPGNLVY